jgi:hypothetical protein
MDSDRPYLWRLAWRVWLHGLAADRRALSYALADTKARKNEGGARLALLPVWRGMGNG